MLGRASICPTEKSRSLLHVGGAEVGRLRLDGLDDGLGRAAAAVNATLRYLADRADTFRMSRRRRFVLALLSEGGLEGEIRPEQHALSHELDRLDAALLNPQARCGRSAA